jgi:hypothetical protein
MDGLWFAGLLFRQPRGRQLAKFVVDQRQQLPPADGSPGSTCDKRCLTSVMKSVRLENCWYAIIRGREGAVAEPAYWGVIA